MTEFLILDEEDVKLLQGHAPVIFDKIGIPSHKVVVCTDKCYAELCETAKEK